MNPFVKESLEQLLQSLDNEVVWQSETQDHAKVNYEIQAAKLAELREQRRQVAEFLAKNHPKVGDVVEVSGPLTLEGEPGCVYLTRGERGTVVEPPEDGHPLTVRVRGHDSGSTQWIDISSLTPVATEPSYDDVHDYVYEEGDDD